MQMKLAGCVVVEHVGSGKVEHNGRHYRCEACGNIEPRSNDLPKMCRWCSSPKYERFMSYREADLWRVAINRGLPDESDTRDRGILNVMNDAFDYGTQKDLTAIGDAFLRMSKIRMNDERRSRIYLACGLLLLATDGSANENG